MWQTVASTTSHAVVLEVRNNCGIFSKKKKALLVTQMEIPVPSSNTVLETDLFIMNIVIDSFWLSNVIASIRC